MYAHTHAHMYTRTQSLIRSPSSHFLSPLHPVPAARAEPQSRSSAVSLESSLSANDKENVIICHRNRGHLGSAEGLDLLRDRANHYTRLPREPNIPHPEEEVTYLVCTPSFLSSTWHASDFYIHHGLITLNVRGGNRDLVVITILLPNRDVRACAL